MMHLKELRVKNMGMGMGINIFLTIFAIIISVNDNAQAQTCPYYSYGPATWDLASNEPPLKNKNGTEIPMYIESCDLFTLPHPDHVYLTVKCPGPDDSKVRSKYDREKKNLDGECEGTCI